MKIIYLALLTAMLSCQKEPVAQASAERIEAAFIYENGLAYDSCEEMIQLQTDMVRSYFTGYKPTAATLPLVQKALKDIPAESGSSARAVTVRFLETGKRVQLECGWGKRPEVPELEVLEITKR